MATVFDMEERNRAVPLEFRPKSCLENRVKRMEMRAAQGQRVLEVLTSRVNTQVRERNAKVRAGKTMGIKSQSCREEDCEVTNRKGVSQRAQRSEDQGRGKGLGSKFKNTEVLLQGVQHETSGHQ